MEPDGTLGDGTSQLGRRAVGSRALLIVVGVGVSALFTYIAVRHAHPRQTGHALAETQYLWLVPSLALLAVALFIRAVRWQSLFAREQRPPLGPIVTSTFIGYVANAVLPARAGEAARTVALNKTAKTPIAQVVGTVIVERAEDVLSLVFLLFVMLPWLPDVSWIRGAGYLAVALVLVLAICAGILLVWGEGAARLLLRPLARLPVLPRESLERAPEQFTRGLVGLVSPRIAIVSFAWTMLSWLLLGAAFWLVLKASGIDLSPLAGQLVVIGIGLAMILPSSPAALGVFEGATVVVLAAYGVNESEALSYALLLHALNILPLLIVAVGVLAFRRLRSRRSAARTPVAGPESDAP
jgi:glycosyltransferase 2 family protein